MAENGERPQTDMVGALFGFRGKIDRRRYVMGLLIAMAVLLAATMSAASAMNPTGGGAPLLAIPLLAVFIWMLAALSTQRFRDAGWSAAYVIVQFGVLGLAIYPGMELVETFWPIPLAGIIVALIFPAFASTREAAGAPHNAR